MPSDAAWDRWMYCRTPRPEARLRLLCFPYAGSGISVFHAWPAEFPPDIEVWVVQYPGRERRYRETPFDRMTSLVAELTDALAGPLADRPFACFGYSLGALVAFELIRSLRRRQGIAPVRLFASACAAPQVVTSPFPIHALPDAALIREVDRRYQAIPAAVLQDAELLNFYLPALRADFSVLETYSYQAEPPLDCPLSAFGGDDDPTVTRWAIEPWRAQTRGSFRLRLLPGNHFFIQTQRPQLIQAIVEDLAEPDQK